MRKDKHILIRVPDDLKEEIEQVSSILDISMSEFIRIASVITMAAIKEKLNRIQGERKDGR